MTLNYSVIVERYLRLNGVVGGSINVVKSPHSLCDGKSSQVATRLLCSKEKEKIIVDSPPTLTCKLSLIKKEVEYV